jgi:hypothetical protein
MVNVPSDAAYAQPVILYNPDGSASGNAIAGIGVAAGNVAATQLPSVAGRFVLLKAKADNAGNVYIGSSNAVTTANGWELVPGETLGWLPISNTNLLWRICDNAGDDLNYWVLE